MQNSDDLVVSQTDETRVAAVSHDVRTMLTGLLWSGVADCRDSLQAGCCRRPFLRYVADPFEMRKRSDADLWSSPNFLDAS